MDNIETCRLFVLDIFKMWILIKHLPDKYFNGEPCIADVLNVDEGDVRVGGVLVQGPNTRVTISDQSDDIIVKCQPIRC